jgi:hypothetical protein
MEAQMKKPKPQSEKENLVPKSFRRLIATIRIPDIAEEKRLNDAANECAEMLEGSAVRGH